MLDPTSTMVAKTGAKRFWTTREERILRETYPQGGAQACAEPVHTVPTRDRLGLVMVEGEPHEIVDIGMRMLSVRELFRAQGFPNSYIVDRGIGENGAETTLTKTASIRMCGNSVCPPMAEALVRANYLEGSVEADPPQEPLFRAIA